MKPKRIPWPHRKKTLVWSLTAALLVVVLMAGHFLCFTPGQAIRAAESHAGTGPTQVVMEGAVGNVPLYLSQNHRAWMVTPFRLGLFHDWRNNGQPLMVIDRSGAPGGRHRRGTPLLGRQQRSVPVPPSRLCGPARRRLRGGPLHPYGPVLRVHRSGTHRRHPPDRRDRRLLLGDCHPPWGHHLSPSRSADGAGPGRPSPVHL